jgi:hypothetical protein
MVVKSSALVETVELDARGRSDRVRRGVADPLTACTRTVSPWLTSSTGGLHRNSGHQRRAISSVADPSTSNRGGTHGQVPLTPTARLVKLSGDAGAYEMLYLRENSEEKSAKEGDGAR